MRLPAASKFSCIVAAKQIQSFCTRYDWEVNQSPICHVDVSAGVVPRVRLDSRVPSVMFAPSEASEGAGQAEGAALHTDGRSLRASLKRRGGYAGSGPKRDRGDAQVRSLHNRGRRSRMPASRFRGDAVGQQRDPMPFHDHARCERARRRNPVGGRFRRSIVRRGQRTSGCQGPLRVRIPRSNAHG